MEGGTIYKVIEDNIPKCMQSDTIEILEDTVIESEQRAKMILQGTINSVVRYDKCYAFILGGSAKLRYVRKACTGIMTQ